MRIRLFGMADLQRAIEIAVAAHRGVADKEGKPYILHPLRIMLALQSQGEAAQIVGVLHDVVEDTDVTLDDIRRDGFADDVMSALALVTHEKAVPYADYVVAAKANPIARAVKLADLADNTRLDRTLVRPGQTVRDRTRVYRYLLSYKYLTDAMGEADYRKLMIENEG
jgi:(p)ppGpp synthase/HD superfamily hydrolase